MEAKETIGDGCGRKYANSQFCSKEGLAKKAQDIEVTIPTKKSQEARYNLDPGSFFENRFWGRRAINEHMRSYIF